MSHLLRHGVWVAVCDGGKALLLENVGDHDLPNLQVRVFSERPIPPARLLGSSPPGRAFVPGGVRRAAHAQNDLHEQAEREFLAAFAQSLDQAANTFDIGGMILVAPARALGFLRPLLTEKIRSLLAAQLVRDYAGLPLGQIERRLCQLKQRA